METHQKPTKSRPKTMEYHQKKLKKTWKTTKNHPKTMEDLKELIDSGQKFVSDEVSSNAHTLTDHINFGASLKTTQKP